MSAKLMGMVYELDLPAAQKAVLVALADHAESDGSSVHPSLEYTAEKVSVSERTVQRAIDELVKIGLLLVVANESGGRGRVPEYQICIEKGVRKQFFIDHEKKLLERRKGVTESPNSRGKRTSQSHPLDKERVTNESVKGDSVTGKGDSVSCDSTKYESSVKHKNETDSVVVENTSESETTSIPMSLPAEPSVANGPSHLLWRIEISNHCRTPKQAVGRELAAAAGMLAAEYTEDEIVRHFEEQRDQSWRTNGYTLHKLSSEISGLHGKRPAPSGAMPPRTFVRPGPASAGRTLQEIKADEAADFRNMMGSGTRH